MVHIKKSDILALLTAYHQGNAANAHKDNKEKTSRFLRKFSKKMPALITKLETFMLNLSSENDELSSPELFQLLEVLLSPRVRTSLRRKSKASKWLAQQLDAKFEKPRMDCFRACLALNQLNQNVFDFICAMDNLQMLPNKAELLRWLEKNNLIPIPKSALAISELEKTGLLSTYLTTQEVGRASIVSKSFRGIFQPALNIKAATQLGQYIVYANLKNAEQFIKNNPSLLRITVTVKDYSDRQITGTALQLALGAKDVRFHENEIAMVEMITHYLLKKFPDGEIIAAQQIIEQLPEGWEAAYEARRKRDQAALDAFVAAIAGSEEPMDWEAAAVIYRNHFDNENRDRDTIETGFHNNDQAVVAWITAYNDHYEAFGNAWNSPKNRFLWQKGSYCKRNLTAANAMALARNLWKFLEKDDQVLERCLDFLWDEGHFFPLDSDLSFRLGYDHGGLGQLDGDDGAAWLAGRDFTNISDKKHQRCIDLRKRAAQTLKQNTITQSSRPK